MSTLTPAPTYAPVERVVMSTAEFAALRETAARLEAALLACEAEPAQLRAELDEANGRTRTARAERDNVVAMLGDMRAERDELAAKLAAVPVDAILRYYLHSRAQADNAYSAAALESDDNDLCDWLNAVQQQPVQP